jgi:predicted acetyltransferase
VTSGKTTIRRAEREDRSTIARLLDVYLQELRRHREVQVGAVDAKTYPYLDLYWEKDGYHPYLIVSSGHVAGFALVRGPEATESGRWQVAELFVSPEWRRKGTGGDAAKELLRRNPGTWELQVHARNVAGIGFWTAVIRRVGAAPTPIGIQAADGRRWQYEFQVGALPHG